MTLAQIKRSRVLEANTNGEKAVLLDIDILGQMGDDLGGELRTGLSIKGQILRARVSLRGQQC